VERAAHRAQARRAEAPAARSAPRRLQRQINPHFLFNTLNSIASLVRSQPELAREMTVKLANILRALLKDHDTYVPLREELSFTDDYLDIEVVRFGADKLKVEKEIDPRTLEVLVPSILLQPLIENSIKHGWSPASTAARSRCAAAWKATAC
jgi:two-component system LytT family sensor kinase